MVAVAVAAADNVEAERSSVEVDANSVDSASGGAMDDERVTVVGVIAKESMKRSCCERSDVYYHSGGVFGRVVGAVEGIGVSGDRDRKDSFS